ncbi:MAG: type II toxin-antitoxin system PemK/MazF family toxin [Gammaproteobacteria bacterium]|nr:type II toxin-antitoxin system PemK/MazF family toxin [Gammaproteobacteria bacterium]MDE0414457.1 type II toxin-antitoxin system PemK/MazF family toxin [Gammaproteobacteria bacterium]
MRRGEIRWYRFAQPDKRRPVLILTRDSIIPSLGEVTVAPLTTRIRNIPSEVALSQIDGPPRECAVNCDHLQTVPRSRLGAPVASLSPQKMEQVAEAVRFALALG